MKRIKILNGVPHFEADGELITPAAYMTYLTKNADFKSFSKCGFGLYSLTTMLGEFAANEETGIKGGFSSPTWIGENEYDFSSLDDDIRSLLEQTGNAEAKIVLRINLNMPAWWRKRYPSELTLYDDGETRMQSICSLRWRTDAGEYLKALKTHLGERGYTKNVIAWQPAAMQTEEWIAPVRSSATEDYSEPSQAAFRRYCMQKYGAIDALNGAWKTTYASFDEVRIPKKTEREGNGEYAVDYYRFRNEAYAEAADWFCGFVKRLFDGDLFVGCFGGYVGQLMKTHGHCAFSKLLQSKNIDFFASPFAYTEQRGKSVDWIYHSPIESTRLAGKLWFLEADVRTSRTKLLPECAPWLFDEPIAYYEAPVFRGPDKENSLRNMLRSFAKVFVSRNAFWWFDMWGGWYADSDYADLIQKTYALYQKEIGTEILSVSEIAVVLDEEASYYCADATFWEGVYGQLVSLGYAGAPYDLFLLQGLKKDDLQKYKAVVFLAPVLKDENVALVEALRADGKSVLVSGDEKKRFAGTEKAYTEGEMCELLKKSGVWLYCAGNIVYANGKYLSVTARRKGTLTVKMPFDCELIDCIGGERYVTSEGTISIDADDNQTYLWEISR